MLAELRDNLRKARTLAESSDMAGVLCTLDQMLADLDDTRLVTIDEAASLLGLRSAQALAVVMHHNGISLERQGDTFVTPLSEVVRLEGSDWVHDMRATDRLHDLADAFGADHEMTQDEMDAGSIELF